MGEFNGVIKCAAGIYRINLVETTGAGSEPKVVGDCRGNAGPEGYSSSGPFILFVRAVG